MMAIEESLDLYVLPYETRSGGVALGGIDVIYICFVFVCVHFINIYHLQTR